jgi:hypothetical protein
MNYSPRWTNCSKFSTAEGSPKPSISTAEGSPKPSISTAEGSTYCKAKAYCTKEPVEYCRKDVILLSSKNAVPKKERRIPTESDVKIQTVNDSDTECGQEMKLADFFKPGSFKRKRIHIENTSSKKNRLGIVYSRQRKTDDF